MTPLLFFKKPNLFHQIRYLSILPSKISENPNPKSNLSARLSFVFDQIDAIDNRTSENFDALQRIRQWRESRAKNDENRKISNDPDENKLKLEDTGEKKLILKKNDVEVVHPWKEWIELMERLGQQNYFDCGRRASEERVAESAGIDLSEVKNEVVFDFSRDWMTVRNACMNFGKDRFDILRSLSKKDIQILVGHGCPSMDPKVVFSAKLLRKYTHLDEGDVCSACSLRNSCSRGYILTFKEDEARTLDIMRVLLTYAFDHVNGAVENKPLMQMKSVKTVVRKLLHEIVKLSAVPIDPNLPPPVIKKPPLKVKQPPPQPKKRVGRDDVEMKKGDWLCPKCGFMNFAKNTVCLQCDAKRPKRQLLPGEWECPQCNFLNYRRNMACFHCDAKRPPDEFTENQFEAKQAGPRMRLDRALTRAQDISNAWNFDFDDNESDGADVAAFEFGNLAKGGDIADLDDLPHVRTPESFEDDMRNTSKIPRARERSRYFSDDNERKSTLHFDRTGFDDFDDEEDDDVDSYELDGSNNSQPSDISKRNFSEIENSSGSEDLEGFEDDELADHPQLKSSHIAESWNKSGRRGLKSPGSDDDIELDSDYDDEEDDMNSGFGSKQRKNHQQSSGRNGIGRRGRDSDPEDDLLLDSDSDGDDDLSYSSINKMRGTKGLSDRRGSDFRKSNNFGNGRQGEFRSDDKKKNRRNSFGDQNDDFSYRGSRRDGYGGKSANNRFEHFDRLDNGNGRQDRYKCSRRENNRFERFDKSDDGKRRQDRSNQFSDRDRSNQFSDRPRGSRRDDRGSRGNGYNESRGNGEFRRERTNNFRDRSRNFEDNSDTDRPRRRVIER